MHEATSRCVYIVKEITQNTCEWTWVQQVDLKISIHAKLLDIAARQQLSWANELQEKFRRNGKEVDREKVAALVKVIQERRGVPLMEDQVEVFERCETLLGEEGGEEGWKALKSTSQDVEMKLKFLTSGATGKAVGVVDSSAEKVAAWMVDYCSRERMQESHERGSPRLELRDLRRENESSVATIEPFPLFTSDREFVFRQVWKSDEGKVSIAIESIDKLVDYGRSKSRRVRGSVRAFWLMENLSLSQGSRDNVAKCKITFVQQVDVAGVIPMDCQQEDS